MAFKLAHCCDGRMGDFDRFHFQLNQNPHIHIFSQYLVKGRGRTLHCHIQQIFLFVT